MGHLSPKHDPMIYFYGCNGQLLTTRYMQAHASTHLHVFKDVLHGVSCSVCLRTEVPVMVVCSATWLACAHSSPRASVHVELSAPTGMRCQRQVSNLSPEQLCHGRNTKQCNRDALLNVAASHGKAVGTHQTGA